MKTTNTRPVAPSAININDELPMFIQFIVATVIWLRFTHHPNVRVNYSKFIKRLFNIETPTYKRYWKKHSQRIQTELDAQHNRDWKRKY